MAIKGSCSCGRVVYKIEGNLKGAASAITQYAKKHLVLSRPHYTHAGYKHEK